MCGKHASLGNTYPCNTGTGRLDTAQFLKGIQKFVRKPPNLPYSILSLLRFTAFGSLYSHGNPSEYRRRTALRTEAAKSQTPVKHSHQKGAPFPTQQMNVAYCLAVYNRSQFITSVGNTIHSCPLGCPLVSRSQTLFFAGRLSIRNYKQPVTKKSVRRQKRSPRTNFGSQNRSPLPILVPHEMQFHNLLR